MHEIERPVVWRTVGMVCSEIRFHSLYHSSILVSSVRQLHPHIDFPKGMGATCFLVHSQEEKDNLANIQRRPSLITCLCLNHSGEVHEVTLMVWIPKARWSQVHPVIMVATSWVYGWNGYYGGYHMSSRIGNWIKPFRASNTKRKSPGSSFEFSY